MEEGMAQRIKALRQEKGLTLEQVAAVVGVGKSTVRKWETGMIANMKRDKIAGLAKALGTTTDYLMGWPENNNSPSELELTEGEKALIKLLRRVPAADQPIVIEKILSALDNQE